MSRPRKAISRRTAAVLTNPLDGVAGVAGVRIHEVGQGDALSVLDQTGQPVFHIDYGGRQASPFKPKPQRVSLIDAAMPVKTGQTLMLSHWDEDHWCSARLGTRVLTDAAWLVPRQLTSPRAVARSTKVKTIRCIPERLVHRPMKFEAVSGDALWWEKLGRFVPGASDEDCNTTGVAFSVTDEAAKEVILMPGDAPYNLARHYLYLREEGYKLRGLLAFHHGADTHWEPATEQLLDGWPPGRNGQVVVFSYGDPNSHGHPHRTRYKRLLPKATVVDMPKRVSFDLTF